LVAKSSSSSFPILKIFIFLFSSSIKKLGSLKVTILSIYYFDNFISISNGVLASSSNPAPAAPFSSF
jgi:hypothetical protein